MKVSMIHKVFFLLTVTIFASLLVFSSQIVLYKQYLTDFSSLDVGKLNNGNTILGWTVGLFATRVYVESENGRSFVRLSDGSKVGYCSIERKFEDNTSILNFKIHFRFLNDRRSISASWGMVFSKCKNFTSVNRSVTLGWLSGRMSKVPIPDCRGSRCIIFKIKNGYLYYGNNLRHLKNTYTLYIEKDKWHSLDINLEELPKISIQLDDFPPYIYNLDDKVNKINFVELFTFPNKTCILDISEIDIKTAVTLGF